MALALSSFMADKRCWRLKKKGAKTYYKVVFWVCLVSIEAGVISVSACDAVSNTRATAGEYAHTGGGWRFLLT